MSAGKVFKRFTVRLHDGDEVTLRKYLKDNLVPHRYDTIRKRLFRYFKNSYLRDIVVPYDSAYLSEIDVGDSDIMPSSRKAFIYIMVDIEDNKPFLFFGRQPINGVEFCRIEPDSMRYSINEGNNWAFIPDARNTRTKVCKWAGSKLKRVSPGDKDSTSE